MFKFLMQFKPDLKILNLQSLTPFTLAAKMARIEIFNYLLEVNRKTYWVYADISCAAYLLREVDTISENGTINTYSALHLVVHGVRTKQLKFIYKKY
jgi:hypothetical protein